MGRIDYREIYHYGIKKRSGRYPYGSGDRPYQSSGGLKGLFRRNKDSSKVLRKGAPQSLFDKKDFLQRKDEILKKGSPAEVLKYKRELSVKEIQNACERFKWEQTLESYAQKETNDTIKKIDIMMKNLKTFNNWATIGTDTYNIMASAYNATSEGKKKPMTLVQKPKVDVDNNQGNSGGGGKGKGKGKGK